VVFPPLPVTIDPPFPIRGGLAGSAQIPVSTPARSRVSSRPRSGERKIDTSIREGRASMAPPGHIPFWDRRTGVGWPRRASRF